MKNIKEIDKKIKRLRSFFYGKYKEYFEKTDGYHKGSEMALDFFLTSNKNRKDFDDELLSINYKNYFKINNKEDINLEIPSIFLGDIMKELEEDLFFLMFSNKKLLFNGDINKYSQILKLIDKDLNIKELLNNHIEKKKIEKSFDMELYGLGKIDKYEELNIKKEEEEFFINKFWYIIEDKLSNINFNNLEDFYNLDINKEIEKRNNIIKSINSIFNNSNIKNIKLNFINTINLDSNYFFGLSIYSYVFGNNGRLVEIIKKNEYEIFSEIENNIEKYFDFEIIEEYKTN